MSEMSDQRDKAIGEAEQAQKQETERQLQARKARFELSKKFDIVKRVFATADGQELLKYMREEFDVNTFDPNPYISACNQGRREVISWIDFRIGTVINETDYREIPPEV